MLIEMRIKNVYSFKEEQTFSLLTGSKNKEIDVSKLIYTKIKSPESLLKLAGFFGANASGKSNFIRSMRAFKKLVLTKNRSLDDEDKRNSFPPPFLLDQTSLEQPSHMEVSFIANKKQFRYGIEFCSGKITSEWLYCAKVSRETMYFERTGDEVEFNARSFSEASDFVTKKGDKNLVKLTPSDVPFLSVIAQFDGQTSKEVIDWFRNVRFVSGIDDDGYRQYSAKKYLKDIEFKKWAMEILVPFQIDDINITEESADEKFSGQSIDDPDLSGLVDTIKQFVSKHKLSSYRIDVIKHVSNTEFEFPLKFESAGTEKLIHILGPLYDAIKNNKILFIDELDSKFHTLLTLHLLNKFYKSSLNSQIFFTAHDTNLLSEKLLSRDQIWFCDKGDDHGTNIYSLLEYKDYYARRYSSYSKDYLIGKYSAIPLLSDIDELRSYIDG